MKNVFSNAKLISAGINSDVYHRTDKARGAHDFPMSRSELLDFNQCPARWLAGHKEPDDDKSESTAWGSLLDVLFLTPEQFVDRYAVPPENYTNEKGEEKEWNWNAKVCKAWRDARPDVECIKKPLYDAAVTASDRLQDDPEIAKLRACSQTQVMIVGEYKDAATGIVVPVKALLDLVPAGPSGPFGKALCDFKTTRSAAPRAWAKSVFAYGYHVQAAFFMDLYNSATGEDRINFLHILQENEAPYQTARRLVSEEFIAIGRDTYLGALQRYAACIKTGIWPSYDPAGEWPVVQPEPWMIMQSNLGTPAQAEPEWMKA